MTRRLCIRPLAQSGALGGGQQIGADQRLFYTRLIGSADMRLAQHLSELKTISTVLKEKQHGKKTR